jgi:hypothetical protein
VTSYAGFYRTYRELLQARYPSSVNSTGEADWERLASPHRLRLPKTVFAQAQAAIAAHYRLLQQESFRRHLTLDQPWLAKVPLRTDAVLMAYDFHTTADGNAYLVEINTNAA